MQQEIIATYLSLMDKLETLPEAVADAQSILTEIKVAQSDSQRLIDEIEDALRPQAAEESNDAKRKAKLAALCAQHNGYRRLAADLAKAKFDGAIQSDAVANLERQYEAVCYQSRLHAGLMQYLGSAGAPVQFNHHGNGQVSAQDAAAIDLGL